MLNYSKKIGILEVIVIILTACLGIRWIPVAGSIGPSSIFFWILGALLFLIPLCLIVMELSQNYTEDGGVYLWVKESLGPKFGFFTAWFYWANNFFFYPGLLVFIVANFAYFLHNPALNNNHLFVTALVIIILWIAIIINILGIKFMARIASFACALNLALGGFLIISGLIYWFYNKTSATSFHFLAFFPNGSILNNLSNLTLLMFALSGVELIPTMADSVNNPKKTLTRGVIISSITVMFIYILGTITINIVLSPAELNNTTGLTEALGVVSQKIHLTWLTFVLITALLLVEFGALIVWLIAPTIMLFECVEKGILPEFMQKTNKYNVPANALILIGVLVSLITIITQYLPTINSIFTALVLMGTIVYFFPYLFLCIGYIKLKLKNRLSTNIISKKLGVSLASILFISVSLGILLSFMPGSDITTTKDLIDYELMLILGPFIFMFSGYLLYIRKSLTNKFNIRSNPKS
ncbi:APC family permease [Rickettsiales bacterium LUAb2]